MAALGAPRSPSSGTASPTMTAALAPPLTASPDQLGPAGVNNAAALQADNNLNVTSYEQTTQHYEQTTTTG